MRRFITLLVALVLCAGATTTNAQVTRYQGEVYIAGGYGIGNNPLNRLQLHTIQGARVGECFSTGVDLGGRRIIKNIESGLFMIPLFADFKLYAPTRSGFDPYLMVDIGYSICPQETQLKGPMFGGGLGFKAGAFNLSVGYHLQQLVVQGISFNMSALQLKLGVAF